jgi:hypothetical protein
VLALTAAYPAAISAASVAASFAWLHARPKYSTKNRECLSNFIFSPF